MLHPVAQLLRPRVAALKAKVQGTTRASLFGFLLAARLVPFTPNWLLNMASPWVGAAAGQRCRWARKLTRPIQLLGRSRVSCARGAGRLLCCLCLATLAS